MLKYKSKGCPISTRLTETERTKFCDQHNEQSTDTVLAYHCTCSKIACFLQEHGKFVFCQIANYISPLVSLHLSECLEGLNKMPPSTMEVSAQAQPLGPRAWRNKWQFPAHWQHDWSHKNEDLDLSLLFHCSLDYFAVNSESDNIFSSVLYSQH